MRELPRNEVQPERKSLVVGSLWMVVLSLLLFFLPLVNGLIGGLVGGYKVGTAGRGLAAALLPAVVVAVGLWIIFAAFEAPILGLLAGAAIGGIVVFSEIGLFIGAAIGGALAHGKARAQLPA